MKLLAMIEIQSISGGYATMSGPFSIGVNGASFQPGAYIEVTGKSVNKLNNFVAYADRVIDTATNEVLYDGSQSSFCFMGNTFNVIPVAGGHRYAFAGIC